MLGYCTACTILQGKRIEMWNGGVIKQQQNESGKSSCQLHIACVYFLSIKQVYKLERHY